MNRRRAAVAAPVLVALTVAALPARAVHGPGCGGSFNRENVCDFALRGLPVRVGGDATVRSGTARVRVWATINTPQGRRTVVACEDEAIRYAECEARFGIGVDLDPLAQTVPMTCHVEGRADTGAFACDTAPAAATAWAQADAPWRSGAPPGSAR